MKQVNFKEWNRLLAVLEEVDGAFEAFFAAEKWLEEQVQAAIHEVKLVHAKQALSEISVEELKRSHAGIRVSVLLEAGYTNLAQLDCLDDQTLQQIDGIGEKQAAAIRTVLAEFTEEIARHCSIRMDANPPTHLLLALTQYLSYQKLRETADPLHTPFHEISTHLRDEVSIRGPLRWLFSRRSQKEKSVRAIGDILQFMDGPLFFDVSNHLAEYSNLLGLTDTQARERFVNHSADYYALLDRFAGAPAGDTLRYGSVPRQLAEEIDAAPLCLEAFCGNLRSYQTFGAKYILHQRWTLLGDEMGLGKTVQAIAAMAHLYADEKDPIRQPVRFLVICPASVLVNWCRELQRFSKIPTFLLHGTEREAQFDAWQIQGGAAVVNYESLGKVIDRIDNALHLALLVVDEAHYMKNPNAQRTKNILRLEEESERILLMTGTPLENNVEEMCSLLDFVRPDLSDAARQSAFMRNTDAFREMLAPVYLRRLRDQVLTELPPLEETQEWCRMSMQDRIYYAQALETGSFPMVRRVSFLQEDMTTSAKGIRLKELCEEAVAEGRRVLVYSYFRETIDKVCTLLGPLCFGTITGETAAAERQNRIDAFSDSSQKGAVLVCQVQAGGTGLNIQAASMVIFCEPQIKPSLTRQAISRVYRMGQVQSVLVIHLLCADTVDEAMMLRIAEKQQIFDTYADSSDIGEASLELEERDWIRTFLENERGKYLAAETQRDAQNNENE